MMRESVFARFLAETVPLEGRIHWPYPDKLGIVTVGIGNAIYSLPAFCSLPWLADGAPASRDVVFSGWQSLQTLNVAKRLLGGGNAFFAELTPLRLTDEAIDHLVKTRCLANEDELEGRFANWEALPDEAQVGTLMLAWACGVWAITNPGQHHFPKFAACLEAGEFAIHDAQGTLTGGCALECEMPSSANPGNDLTRRNTVTRALFEGAQKATDGCE